MHVSNTFGCFHHIYDQLSIIERKKEINIYTYNYKRLLLFRNACEDGAFLNKKEYTLDMMRILSKKLNYNYANIWIILGVSTVAK